MGGVAGAVIAGGGTYLQIVSTPEVTSFRQDIALMLEGGIYPNGTEFSTNDLRSPVVLERVHAEAGLDAFDISLRELSAGLSITPSSATYEGVIERYRTRLADTNLTYAERQQIEEEFSAALAGALATGARIELVLGQDQALPADLGRSVVAAIPNAWSDIYINQLGVLDLPIPGSSSELIKADFLAGLDYPMAHDALVASLEVLEERLAAAMAVPGAQNLQADGSDRTLFDIQRDVGMIERYSLEHVLAPLTELGLNKAPEVTTAAYRYQLDDSHGALNLAEENASVIQAALSTPSGNGYSGINSTTTSTPAQVGVSPSPVVQQFGPELIDRLVSMSVENASVDFREALIQSKLEYERQALSMVAERDRIQQRLALISGQTTIPNEASLTEIFTQETERLAEELNTAWAEVDTILARANVERISHDKELFRFLPTSDPVSTNRTLFDRRTIIVVIGAAIGGAIAGMMAFFLSSAIRRRPA